MDPGMLYHEYLYSCVSWLRLLIALPEKKVYTFQGTNISHWDGTFMGTSSVLLVTWKSGCSAPSTCTFGDHLHCTLGNNSLPACAILFFLTVYGPVISQRGNIVCSQVYIDSNEAHHLCECSVIWSPGRKAGRREIWAGQKSCNKMNSNQFEHQIEYPITLDLGPGWLASEWMTRLATETAETTAEFPVPQLLDKSNYLHKSVFNPPYCHCTQNNWSNGCLVTTK